MQDQTKIFLARVLAWPQEGDAPAYGNIHYTFVPRDLSTARKDKATGAPLYPWAGVAFKDAGSAAKLVLRNSVDANTRDIYFCTSTQNYAEHIIGKKGYAYFKAHRSQDNVSRLKALFIDIDLTDGKKDKSKGYENLKELTAALAQFLRDTGLPKPSMMVFSGGGMHVYWTLMKPVTLEEWLPDAYALAEATKRHGLKCDSACTIDAARVLRVPGTKNHKYDPPRWVKLVGTPVEYDYVNSKISSILEPYRVRVPQQSQNSSMALFPPKAPIIGSDLSAGVDMSSMAPIKLDSLLGKCGFIDEALNTGGASFTNPLWNLTTLMATFTEGGRGDAHRMAQGHPNYGPGETDELYDRKEGERQSGKLGWPRCAAISAAGCTSCATCPLFKEAKSPLNFADKATVTPQGNITHLLSSPLQPITQVPATMASVVVPGTGQQDPDLPDGYLRNAFGIILEAKLEDDGTTTWEPISTYPMTEPFLEDDPEWQITFTTKTSFGRTSHVTVKLGDIGSAELRKALQGQGIMVDLHPRALLTISDFIMSWIKKLQDTKDAVVSSVPFGWSMQGGKVKGFVFSNQMFTPHGAEVSTNTDPELQRQYSPNGDVQPWLDAARMVTDQKRPGLDAILASAFAAPLVKFTGHSGLLLSAFSMESGIGKSTALKVAQAVWGNPVKAIQSLSDTQNSVLHKLGELKSLPMYWDELKSEEDTKKFIDTVFRLTLGKEKSRMNSRVEQRSVGTWETMLVSASNDSLLDGVAFRSRASTAGIYRIFEYTLPPAQPGSPGQINISIAQRVVSKLHDNYGMIGYDYADYLGSNIPQIDADVTAMSQLVEQEIAAKPDERFWVATIATLLQGAKYANDRGYTSIDEVALKVFLYKTLAGMRGTRQSTNVDMRQQSNVVAVLGRFLNENRRNTIRTNIIHRQKGRPANGSVEIFCDISKLDSIHAHVGQDDKVVRIGREYFRMWLSKNQMPVHVLMIAIQEELGAKLVQGRLGGGTPMVGMMETLFEIDLTNSTLMNFIDEA